MSLPLATAILALSLAVSGMAHAKGKKPAVDDEWDEPPPACQAAWTISYPKYYENDCKDNPLCPQRQGDRGQEKAFQWLKANATEWLVFKTPAKWMCFSGQIPTELDPRGIPAGTCRWVTASTKQDDFDRRYLDAARFAHRAWKESARESVVTFQDKSPSLVARDGAIYIEKRARSYILKPDCVIPPKS